MPFNFEQDREDHKIHHIKMPQGHAHMDEKHQKMGRSPIVGQLPMDNRTESPQVNQGLDSGDASLGS